MTHDNDDDTDDTLPHSVGVAQLRVHRAREAMRHGDTIAAGWWFYGVGPAGTRPDFSKPYTPTKQRSAT